MSTMSDTQMQPTPQPEGGKRGVSRRTLAQGAAWSVPAVAVAAAAPTMAASCTPQTWLVEPQVDVLGGPSGAGAGVPTIWKTTPMVITIPAGDCPITYTIRGGDGGAYYGGTGIVSTGTITRSDTSKPLTLTLIAGAKGEIGNPQIVDFNTGGPGYGKGGSGTWLGWGLHGANNGHAVALSGGGGGGSAILMGTATSTTQTSTTPLIVAGGGGGGGAFSSGGTSSSSSGRRPGGSAAAPGVIGDQTDGTDLAVRPTPEAPFGDIFTGPAATPSAWYGFSQAAGHAARAANGATGGAGAYYDTSAGVEWSGTLTGWSITSKAQWWAPGGAGGDHGTGMYGGGNGGIGNTASLEPNYEYTVGAMGGGGYAGGGGGMSSEARATFHNDTTNSSVSGYLSWGSAGAAGSSYVATTSLPNPNGGTVTITATWTPQTPTSGTNVHGKVQINFG